MLQVTGLNKRFSLVDAKKTNKNANGDKRIRGRFFYAIQDISFEVKAGNITGLLGANGAGKTTLLRLLSSALEADSGDIVFNDQPVQKNIQAYRKKIGFLSGTTGLYQRLTGRENLTYFAGLYGLTSSQTKSRIHDLNKLLELDSFLDRRFSDYSAGMKQKIAIARAVIHEPELVIFDEPTTGLDIIAKEIILNFIQTLKKQNIAVIFSTHDLAEIEHLCDDLVVLNQANLIFCGTQAEIKTKTEQPNLHDALFYLMDSSRLKGEQYV